MKSSAAIFPSVSFVLVAIRMEILFYVELVRQLIVIEEVFRVFSVEHSAFLLPENFVDRLAARNACIYVFIFHSGHPFIVDVKFVRPL